MGDTIGKLFTYILFVAGVILALVIFLTKFDTIIETNISDNVTNFVDECRTTGKIDAQNYNDFCRSVYRCGNYDIEMEYSSLTTYPDESESGYRQDYSTYNMDYILSQMFPNDTDANSFNMKNGDTLTVTVTKGSSYATKIVEFFLKQNLGDTIVVKYSGNIGNNG